jgi:NAD(P)-dependent dehydrogenase (short-subunit alcohol dehydrogenase family)
VASLQKMFPRADVSAIPADLSKPAEVTRFVSEVGKKVKSVHILMANAGATWGAPLDTHPDSAFAKVMDLNVRSVFNLVRDMIPLLEAAGTKEDPARVVTVGSVAGLHIGPVGEHGTYGYAASKAAVHHLTKHLAVALGPRRILVNAIAPGWFPTKMASGLINVGGGVEEQGEQSPNKRLGLPEDIVGVMVFLCSRAAGHVNGAIIPVDGGMHLVPGSKL